MNSRVAVEIMGWEIQHLIATRTGEKFWNYKGPEGKRIEKSRFTPTTDLNHAKMAWDKLSVEQAMHCASAHAVNIGNGDVGPISAILDPEYLCELMLSAVAAKGGG